MEQLTKAEPPINPAFAAASFIQNSESGGNSGKAQQAQLPPMNWVLSVPRGVRAQLIITGTTSRPRI